MISIVLFTICEKHIYLTFLAVLFCLITFGDEDRGNIVTGKKDVSHTNIHNLFLKKVQNQFNDFQQVLFMQLDI